MKQKQILPFLLILSSFIFSSAQCQSPYFEGNLEYQIEYVSLIEGVNAEQLVNLKGNAMIFSVKEGVTSRAYLGEFKRLIEKTVFYPDSCLSYQWRAGIDTLLVSHSNKRKVKISQFTILPDTVIDELRLHGLQLKLSSNSVGEVHTINCTYYFYDQLKANPKWYVCFKEGAWNKVIKEMGSLPYWYKIEDSGFYSAVFKCIRINRGKVNEAEFQFVMPDKSNIKK